MKSNANKTLFGTFPRKLIRAIGIILTVIISGYISNVISTSACRDRTIQEVTQVVNAQSITRGKSIVWIDEADVVSVPCEDVWGEDCATFELFNLRIPYPWFFPDKYHYMPKPSAIDYFEGDGSNPYAFIKTMRWDLPFVVRVNYGWMAGALWGRGGAKYYICLFGLTFELKDVDLWIS